MKKAFFALITVFLSLALFSCLFTAPETDKEPVQYTEDGRPLVELTIGTTASRALTAELARAGVNYYEVVFYDGSAYYRTAWHKAQGNGKLIVPAGDYDDATKAILFAGTYEDKTLLAAGTLTAVTPINTPVTEITTSTTSVTFTLTALTSGVSDSKATSSFEITGPTTDFETPASIPTLNLGGNPYPVFRVPADTTAVPATFTIDGLTSTGAGIILDAADGVLRSASYSSLDFPGIKTIPLTLGDVAYTPTSGDLGAVSGVLTIAIDTEELDGGFERGYGLLYIEVPVSAIDESDNTGGLTWYIRGGIGNNSLDAGVAAKSIGGAILLCTVSNAGITVVGNLP